VPTDPADAITPEQIDHIYRTLIRPTVFADAPGGETTPTLILLGGQAGSGKSRASARLLTERDGMIALSGDDLRIFHPNYRDLLTDQPEQAGPILAEATRPWVRAVLRDCLNDRRSLLLEGSFGDPDATLTTASRFRDAGFNVRIVAIASPRVLSVVTATSRYLRDLKVGAPARFTPLSAHDHGYDGTTRLIDSLVAKSPMDRVTIVSRNGTVLQDEHRDAHDEFLANGARGALRDGRHPSSWGARSTMELLGELKQITDFAINSGHLTADVADLLTEAHSLALEEVVPRLSIDADSSQAKFIRQAVTEQFIALRRSRRDTRPDQATEVVQPVADIYDLDR
jgi:UDP-N-acetylglucosamine kinase